MISVAKAIQLILENTTPTVTKKNIFIYDAKNFSLATTLAADRDYPPFHRATMDGYAIRFTDFEKGKEFTIIGEIYAGDNWNYPQKFPDNPAIKIMTGSAVPDNFDTIIKVEDSVTKKDKVSLQPEKIFPFMNIAKRGEDILEGNILEKTGKLIDDSVLIIAASMGYRELSVYTPPKVSIIGTGNEVIPIEQIPSKTEIRDSNSILIESLFAKYKAILERKILLPDDPDTLKKRFSECLDSDFCVITGGVSAGDKDYIPQALKEIGVREIFHKTMIRPGKPIWFGKKENTLFFGLPGNPFSARVTFKVFIEPAIQKFLHLTTQQRFFLPLLHERKKKHSLEEYFRVKLTNKEKETYLQEITSNGSGDFLNSLNSDGIALHPADKEYLPQGENVEFLFW